MTVEEKKSSLRPLLWCLIVIFSLSLCRKECYTYEYPFELKLENQENVTRVWLNFYLNGKWVANDTHWGTGTLEHTYKWLYPLADMNIFPVKGDVFKVEYSYNDWRDRSVTSNADTIIVQ